MARATMTELIAEVRNLIQDPSGASEVFADGRLEQLLDDNRADVNYAELLPIESVAPGGVVSYLAYRARSGGYWEADASLVNGNYEAVAPAASDYRRGVWRFVASQAPPIFVTGSQYNVYGAAVSALEEWLVKLKFAYDFTADGATFRRSQQVTNIQAMIARYQGMAGVQVMTMSRSDVIC